MNKVCKVCNDDNPVSASVCESCGTAFEDIFVNGKPIVTLIRDDYQIELPKDGLLIGRTCCIAPELFNHTHVSETHCKISINDTDCDVEDIGSDGVGSTNGTFIDGVRLPKRVPTKIYDGSTLRIAHLLFDVKVDYPTSCLTEENIELYTWVIVCKGCGKEYPVENKDVRIKECDRCVDVMDRKLIAKEVPKQIKR